MNIVFVVNAPFPFGDASSIRAYNICKLLKSTGNTIHVISDYPSKDSNGDASEICTFEHCVSKKPSFGGRKHVVSMCLEKLEKYIINNKVDIVFTNARYDRFNKIVKICDKYKLKLIVENCEWYHYSSFKLKMFDLRYYKNQKMIMFDFKSADGFISISRLLNEHNKSFGKKSVRIPTIMDVQNMDYSTEVNNDKINIIYTGNTGRSKEFLKPVFSTFSKYKYLAERIEFNIYGPDRSAVIANIGDKDLVDENNECIHIHGKVPQNSIPIVMQNADFLLFIRPNRRSSNAGFPTKFGESMTAGTPVITNNTGDINLYLKNSQNGFLLKDSTEGAVKEVFDQIIKLSDEERMILRINARKTAEESFDYRIYEKEINYLLE